jgi:hypothetical protein
VILAPVLPHDRAEAPGDSVQNDRDRIGVVERLADWLAIKVCDELQLDGPVGGQLVELGLLGFVEGIVAVESSEIEQDDPQSDADQGVDTRQQLTFTDTDRGDRTLFLIVGPHRRLQGSQALWRSGYLSARPARRSRCPGVASPRHRPLMPGLGTMGRR